MSSLSMNTTKHRNYYDTNRRRIGVIGIAVVLLLILLSAGLITQTVKAERTGNRAKLITSVEVKKGDSLWSIAAGYMSDEYDNIHDYIEEIMKSNGMASEEIHAGNFIIVPYYTDISR